MSMRRTVGAGLTAALVVASLGALAAQAPAVKRTILQQADLSAPGREVVQALAQLKKAGETLRLRQERAARASSNAVDATLTVTLELARLGQIQAELQVAQSVQARASARSGRDAWNEPLSRMDQEIERVRPHQHLSQQDLAMSRGQSEADR